MHELEVQPWYKQFWPWFLISLPFSAVVAGVATIIIANLTFDGLVVDDYYKQGKAINREKGRDHMAAHLGLSAQLDMDMSSHRLHLKLDSKVSIPEQALHLTLLHPTRAGGDVELELQSLGAGAYTASLPVLHEAHWNLLLVPGTGEWRLRGRYPGGPRASVRMASEG